MPGVGVVEVSATQPGARLSTTLQRHPGRLLLTNLQAKKDPRKRSSSRSAYTGIAGLPRRYAITLACAAMTFMATASRLICVGGGGYAGPA